MSSDLYFQTVVQFRIPMGTDGTPGKPEIIKRFTSPIKGAQNLVKKKEPKPVKKVVQLQGGKTEEEFI